MIGRKCKVIIMDKIKRFLKEEYGLNILLVKQMTTGVGGDTFHVNSIEGEFIFKIADTNDINRPELEPEICSYLLEKGIKVSEFRRNLSGNFISQYDERYCHLQHYFQGKTFKMNKAPQWFMNESPALLGKIHATLQSYDNFPIGIGEEFFNFMTLERARESYEQSLRIAVERQDEKIIDDLDFRIKLVKRFPKMQFDTNSLTYKNTHGDYTLNQILCKDDHIEAVIDWTSACMHPVIWEITRSFYYAEPTCANGELDKNKFMNYIDSYCQFASLNAYDKDNILRLYYYQLAVCDYYSQYLSAEDSKKDEFLLQATFATKILKKAFF